MNVSDSFMPSSSGLGDIRVRTWEPDGQASAVLQIAHGVAEYVDRYDDFAAFLVSKGYKVVANDHLGHGQSAGKVKGWFGKKDGWFHVVDDMKRVYDANFNEAVPYFMLGHSMGSFLLRTFLIKYPDANLTGTIISGTGWQGGLTLKAGLLVCSSEESKLGSDGVSARLSFLAFGSYNKKIQNPRTKNDWLSRREDIVDKYNADPLCGFDMTVGLARDMFTGIKYNQDKANLAKMDKNLPVLFLSGEADPVGGYGKGVEKSKAAFDAAGMNKVDIKLYPDGRHEMLNEINNQEVYGDILSWLEKQKKDI